jgi:hypothetical protein
MAGMPYYEVSSKVQNPVASTSGRFDPAKWNRNALMLPEGKLNTPEQREGGLLSRARRARRARKAVAL